MVVMKDVEMVDVAVVGGGPTGLFTGLLLMRLGISVRILDAKPQSLELGRADALNARTQQYFEVAKLLDPLLPKGVKCSTSSTFGEGDFKSRQSAWWDKLQHALHKNFLMLGQPVIEKLMSDELGPIVRYCETVSSINEGDDCVDIVTKSGHHVRSRYAIGADGARSTVRNDMGVRFTGTKPGMLWAVLDTFIDTDFPTCPEIITFELDGQSRVSWIPRERGLSRFYVLLDGDETQDRAHDSIRKHMKPYRVDFRKTEWYSTFEEVVLKLDTVKERVASSFVSKGGSGRLILAGDAAHVHSVNGGQGLNTGIADAFSLAWRLATVVTDKNLKAGATDKLIRSYDTERRGTAQNVVDVAAVLVRETVHTAKQYVGTIEKHAAYITGMGVSYEASSSPLVWESEHGIWKAGHRCPDVILKSLNSRITRLYSEVIYGKHILLYVGDHKSVDFAHKDVVVSYHVRPLTREIQRHDNFTMNDSSTKVYQADWASESHAFVVVVRPDMYIGFVGKDAKACEPYFDELYS